MPDDLLDAPRDLYLGGKWVPAGDGGRFEVHDPSTGDVLADVADATVADALAAVPGPTGVLVVGDGSARRTFKAPGYLDPGAGPFDSTVSAALAMS